MSLAKSIRAQERDTYDLAGHGATQIAELCSAAFSTPVDAPAPFRVTFIVGGGKKVRTGYGGPEGLVRETCNALEALSFTEDRSASLGQQGVFKYQHDTDKDLKFVHVFPHVNTASSAPADGGAQAGEGGGKPEEVVLACTLEALQKQVPRRVATFAQKQTLLKHLKAAAATVAAVEAKLAKLAKLELPTAEEQAIFDSATALGDKIEWVQHQMEAHIEAGQLSKTEQEGLVAQLSAKLKEADAAIAAATAEGKAARAEKLAAARAALVAKRDAAAAVKPVAQAVKFEKELRQLRVQLAELEKIEAARGLQSLETIKKLREKPGIEQQLADIYAANKGWFEDSEAFEKRMKAAGKAPAAGAGVAAKPSGAGAPGGFVTPKSTAAKPKAGPAKTATSNPWAALGA